MFRSMDEPGASHVRLRAGQRSSGEWVYEDVHVTVAADGAFEVEATPRLVLGVAAGDVIRVDSDGGFTVTRRGGNVAIHVYGSSAAAEELVEAFGRLGGRVDASDARLTVLSVPVAAGFAAIEAPLRELCHRLPDVEWHYGNVYADDGVTPLNWW